MSVDSYLHGQNRGFLGNLGLDLTCAPGLLEGSERRTGSRIWLRPSQDMYGVLALQLVSQ